MDFRLFARQLLQTPQIQGEESHPEAPRQSAPSLKAVKIKDSAKTDSKRKSTQPGTGMNTQDMKNMINQLDFFGENASTSLNRENDKIRSQKNTFFEMSSINRPPKTLPKPEPIFKPPPPPPQFRSSTASLTPEEDVMIEDILQAPKPVLPMLHSPVPETVSTLPPGLFFRGGGGMLNAHIDEETRQRVINLFGTDDTDGMGGLCAGPLQFGSAKEQFSFKAAAGAFGRAGERDVERREEERYYEEPAWNSNPVFDTNPFSNASVGFFSNFQQPNNGGLVFQTGNMKPPKGINEDFMARARALLADSDDEKSKMEESSAIQPFQVPFSTARAHENSTTGFDSRTNALITPSFAQNKKAFIPPKPLANKNFENQAVEVPEHAKLQTAPLKKNPFLEDEQDHSLTSKKNINFKKTNGRNKLTVVPAKPAIHVLPTVPELADHRKIKTKLSLFHDKVSVDFARYKQLIAKVIAKKKPRVTWVMGTTRRDYGGEVLQMDQIYAYMQQELRHLGIQSPEQMITELHSELSLQLTSPDLTEEWVKHHTIMLSRKYKDAIFQSKPYLKIPVKMRGIVRSREACIYPVEINSRTLLTDLYYRYKREKTYESYSPIQQYKLGVIPPECRVCLVVSMIEVTSTSCLLELSDGWYTMATQFDIDKNRILKVESELTSSDGFFSANDDLLLRLLLSGRLKIGDKVEVSNLPIPKADEHADEKVIRYERLMTQIPFNSLKKLPQDARLGKLFTYPKPTLLSRIRMLGGTVPLVDVIVIGKKGLKKKFDSEEYVLAFAQDEDLSNIQVSFSLWVIDSIHLDSSSNLPIAPHLVSFKNMSPGAYMEIEIGQRLRLGTLKAKRKILRNYVQINTDCKLQRTMTLYQSGKNRVETLETKGIFKPSEMITEFLEPWKRKYVELDKLVSILLTFSNVKTGSASLMTFACRYMKYKGHTAMFHLFETHFVKIELKRSQYTIDKLKDSEANQQSKNGKQDDKEAKQIEELDSQFWERIAKTSSAPADYLPSLVIFYDLEYQRTTKSIEYRGGYIYIHNFSFHVDSDFLLGESVLHLMDSGGSLEQHLVDQYKKHRKYTLPEGETLTELITKINKLPFSST